MNISWWNICAPPPQFGRVPSTWAVGERGAMVGETFVGDCEQVISLQNEA